MQKKSIMYQKKMTFQLKKKIIYEKFKNQKIKQKIKLC